MSTPPGYKWTAERTERQRQTLMGHTVSEETREKIRQKLLGTKLSEEHRRKLLGRAVVNKGVPMPDEQKIKLRKRFCVNGHDTHILGRKKSACVPCRKDKSWKAKKIRVPGQKFFTTLDYDRNYQIQSGSCLICRRHQSELEKPLQVDHCHKTGLFRGLLCHKCNMVLRDCQDTAEVLEAAVLYLEAHAFVR